MSNTLSGAGLSGWRRSASLVANVVAALGIGAGIILTAVVWAAQAMIFIERPDTHAARDLLLVGALFGIVVGLPGPLLGRVPVPRPVRHLAVSALPMLLLTAAVILLRWQLTP